MSKPTGRNFGEKNGNSKLNDDKVKAIFYSKGKLSQQELADIYGVHRCTIAEIHAGITWRHITNG